MFVKCHPKWLRFVYNFHYSSVEYWYVLKYRSRMVYLNYSMRQEPATTPNKEQSAGRYSKDPAEIAHIA